MPFISEWSPSDPFQALVYGKAKVGKSAGALTFPRPVVMDFDKGVATARNDWFVSKYGQREIFYEIFDEKNLKRGIPTAHNAFDDACRFYDEWMKPGGRWVGSNGRPYTVGLSMFDTWIIDSGTTLSEIAQYKAVLVLGKMGLSKTAKESAEHGVLVPKIQDFGSERSLVEQFIDMVRGSGKNVVLICHEKEQVNDAGNTIAIVPLLTGKSAESVPLKFDEVYNLKIKPKGTEMLRVLQTEADGLYKVGSRYGVPNGTEWNWDALQKILKEIKTKQLTQTKEVQSASHQS